MLARYCKIYYFYTQSHFWLYRTFSDCHWIVA